MLVFGGSRSRRVCGGAGGEGGGGDGDAGGGFDWVFVAERGDWSLCRGGGRLACCGRPLCTLCSRFLGDRGAGRKGRVVFEGSSGSGFASCLWMLVGGGDILSFVRVFVLLSLLVVSGCVCGNGSSRDTGGLVVYWLWVAWGLFGGVGQSVQYLESLDLVAMRVRGVGLLPCICCSCCTPLGRR